MKRVAINTAVVLATLAVVLLIWQFSEAVVLFAISLAIAAAVRPLADRFVERGYRRGLALLLLYSIGIAVFVMLLLVISGPLLVQLQRAGDDFTAVYEHVHEHWPEGNSFQQSVAAWLPPAGELFEAITGEEGSGLAQALLGATLGLFALLANLLIVLVLSIYWGTDREHFERLWLSLLPAGGRTRARTTWRAIEAGVGAYIRSELVQSLLAGILLGVGFRLMGMPYPTVLAVGGALAWLFPYVGGLLAIIPVLLAVLPLALLEPQLALALGLLGSLYTIAVFLILEAYVEPRIFRRRYYSPILIVLMVIAVSNALGLLGILIAPPLAAATQIFFGRLLRQPDKALAPDHAHSLAELQERFVLLRQLVQQRQEPAAPEIESVVERLERLLKRARDTVGGDPALAAEEQARQRGATAAGPGGTSARPNLPG